MGFISLFLRCVSSILFLDLSNFVGIVSPNLDGISLRSFNYQDL